MSLLLDAFRRMALGQPRETFVRSASETLTYGDAWERMSRAVSLMRPLAGHRVGVQGTSADSLMLLVALDAVGAEIWLLPRHAAHALAETHRLAAVLERLPVAPVAINGDGDGDGRHEIVLFTAGTTGSPKAVAHTWETLTSRVVRSDALRESRWLFPYQIATFAGMQVVLHAILNGASLTLTPVPETSFADIVDLAIKNRVTHLPGTPSFFRFLLAAAPASELSRIPVRQLTLGGEIVDQVVLDCLKRQYPDAAITHIYASSETGVCFSVHDGCAGFPADYLSRDDLPTTLRVADGELQVRSAHRFKRYSAGSEPAILPDQFISTGDLVEQRGDRYHFLGRRENIVNVGGRKVATSEVEAVMLAVDGVLAAQASPCRSSLAGQLVQASVVVRDGHDHEVVRRAIVDACRDQLEAYKRPRLIRFVSDMALSEAGKIRRLSA